MSKSDSEQYSVPGFKKDKLIAKPRRECQMDVDLAYDFSRIRLDEEDVHSELSEAELPADDDPTSPQMEKKFTPDACLFVASLVSSRTEKQLQESVTDHFERWGALDNVKVLKDSMNRPYSFVQFREVESAERALREAHNTLVDGRHIRVEKARVNRKLYITRISTGLKEEELQEALWIHGPLDSFRMMRNAATGDAKGSCFVQYRFREDAIKAFMSIKNLGRWEVEWASTQEKIPRSYDFNSIFVGQLSPSQITRDSLDARFKTYGVIDNLSLINKPTADNAFAFIKYSSQDACVRAIEGEDGIFWHDRPMRVQFKEAGPKPRNAPKSRRPLHSYPYPIYAYPPPTHADGTKVEDDKAPMWVAQYPIFQNPDGTYAQAPTYYLIGPQSYQGNGVPSPQSLYTRPPTGYIPSPAVQLEH